MTRDGAMQMLRIIGDAIAIIKHFTFTLSVLTQLMWRGSS